MFRRAWIIIGLVGLTTTAIVWVATMIFVFSGVEGSEGVLLRHAGRARVIDVYLYADGEVFWVKVDKSALHRGFDVVRTLGLRPDEFGTPTGQMQLSALLAWSSGMLILAWLPATLRRRWRRKRRR
ncbi:MAG: hypothetical protein L0219_06885 [Phycisphaerales bacterium]|nr:hypothetical protein [Phycisphaerales bacterium]